MPLYVSYLSYLFVSYLYHIMPSSHCTILARFFTHRQVLINRRQMPEIGGKLVLIQASDNHAVWIIKDTIWENRRCVTDAREIFVLLNIWSCRRFTILLCEMSSDEFQNTLAMTYSQWESKIQGSRKFGEDLFFFFTKRALEYTEQVHCKKWCWLNLKKLRKPVALKLLSK